MARMTFVARIWYYFRMGYATYLTFIMGYVTTLVTVYYLAIKDIPSLLNIFPKFIPFAVISTAVGVPLAIGVGWFHLKRSPAYSSEMDIGVESNPWYYKLPPGYWLEVWGPVNLELLLQVKKLLKANELLSEEDRVRIENLEKKLEILSKGGYVGSPRRSL